MVCHKSKGIVSPALLGAAAQRLEFEQRGRIDGGPMRRLFEWMFYAIGFVAILYLALYAYAMFRGREFVPGDPIRIFRSPDAPDYSLDLSDRPGRKPGTRMSALRRTASCRNGGGTSG